MLIRNIRQKLLFPIILLLLVFALALNLFLPYIPAGSFGIISFLGENEGALTSIVIGLIIVLGGVNELKLPEKKPDEPKRLYYIVDGNDVINVERTRTLKYDPEKFMKGEDVKEIQILLNTRGYDLNVDGIFGENTENAVKDFQKNHDLVVDGIVGPETHKKLGVIFKIRPTELQ